MEESYVSYYTILLVRCRQDDAVFWRKLVKGGLIIVSRCFMLHLIAGASRAR